MSRNYKREYATYQGKKEQREYRARLNQDNRKNKKSRLGDGLDLAHEKSRSGKTRLQKASENRSYSRKTKDRKKYGKRYS
jgi:hypothetical protein